jgi:hypothetical protein
VFGRGLADGRSTSGLGAGVRIRLLRLGVAEDEDGPPSVGPRMGTYKSEQAREPAEVSPMLLHVIAEAFPDGARLVGRGWGDVDDDRQTACRFCH